MRERHQATTSDAAASFCFIASLLVLVLVRLPQVRTRVIAITAVEVSAPRAPLKLHSGLLHPLNCQLLLAALVPLLEGDDRVVEDLLRRRRLVRRSKLLLLCGELGGRSACWRTGCGIRRLRRRRGEGEDFRFDVLIGRRGGRRVEVEVRRDVGELGVREREEQGAERGAKVGERRLFVIERLVCGSNPSVKS